MRSTYGQYMTDGNGNNISEGYLLYYNSEYYFRPSDGRYDGVGGYVDGWYGFGSCTYDSGNDSIKMVYSGGTPYLPKYIFTQGLSGTQTGRYFTSSNQNSYVNVIGTYYSAYNCTVNFDTEFDVLVPVFLLATVGDNIGELTNTELSIALRKNNLTSLQSITKLILEPLKLSLKRTECVIESEEYTEDLCILYDDLKAIQKFSLTVDYDFPQNCISFGNTQHCYDTGKYNKIYIKITKPSGEIFYAEVSDSEKSGDNIVIDLSETNVSDITSRTFSNIPEGSEIIIDCSESEATYQESAASIKYTTKFNGFKFNGSSSYTSLAYSYRFIVTRNNTVTLCFGKEQAPIVMVEGVSMEGTPRIFYEQGDNIDYFYIKANENNSSPVYLWLLKYKSGKRNYDYITNVSPNLEYSTDKITWTLWPTITLFLNIPWNETSLGPDLGNNSHRLQFGSWSSADKNAFETNVISNGGIILNPGVKLYLRGNNPGGFNSKTYQWSFTQSFRPIFTTILDIGGYIYVAPDDSSNNNTFTLRSDVSIGGNIMTLIDITGNITEIPNEYCFTRLFAGTESDEILQTWQGFKYVKDPTRIIPDLRLTLIADNTLSATSLKEHCYDSMFDRCHTLTSAGLLPAETLVRDCYYKMYSYCTKLTSIKCNAVTRLDHYYSYLWVDQLPNSGTFYYHNGIDWSNKRNKSSIPSGWTAIPLS